MNGTEAWQKITGNGKATKTGRVGLVPVYDGNNWYLFRNTNVIWPGVENVADPVKVEKLRRNAVALLEAFPETLPQLEKLGIRIKGVLNKPIKIQADVTQWADSIFNTGPTSTLPAHVQDAMDLAYDDFWIQVQGGKNPSWVLPAGPRGSGVMATMDYSVPGSKTRYGPRHEFTKIAFSQQVPREQKSQKDVRPRGRPRKDGLMPGSEEAKVADEIKKAQRKPRIATITELPQSGAPAPVRRILARVGNRAVSS